MVSCVSRPLLRYLGGKWRLASWIISHFPPHDAYVEPFGGAASVLLRKPRAHQEIYNDLDDDLVTLFRVLRSDDADRLIRAVALTPFSRAEFDLAHETTTDPVEAARRLIVRSFMGHGGQLAILRRPTAFRSVNRKSGNAPVLPWANYPLALGAIVERLRGVTIESRPAIEVMRAQDRPGVLHYVDPPYISATRSQKTEAGQLHHRYRHEMDDERHAELLDVLHDLTGKVVISGYGHPLYEDRLAGWFRSEMQTHADGGQKRTEVLWMNFDPAETPPPAGLFGVKEEARW